MTTVEFLSCDGCGQPASPEHIAKRLQRLEWATRYRPIHISMLFLSATAPAADSEFLYSAEPEPNGEATLLLEAVGIKPNGKTRDTLLTEFQRSGFMLAHFLECPVEKGSPEELQKQIEARVPAVFTRIRRSLKPKRVAPVSSLLAAILPRLLSGELGCPVLLDGERAFALDGGASGESSGRLRNALAAPAVTSVQRGAG
jgi:hypothetical protein